MTDPRKQIEIANRRTIVAANLLAGATYREIARAVKVSPATVVTDARAIVSEWRTHYRTDADRYLSIQLRRLDTLLNALWDRAAKGDLAAINTVMSIIDRQCRLLGLNNTPDIVINAPPQIHTVEIIKLVESRPPQE